jgi:hypothetical protein
MTHGISSFIITFIRAPISSLNAVWKTISDHKAGARRQETGDGRQETGDRRQETGDGRRETGNRKQETGKKLRESRAKP